MKNKVVKVENLQELEQYVLDRLHANEWKWKLERDYVDEWVDEIEGAEWLSSLRDARPESKRVPRWRLFHNGSYSDDIIELSAELGTTLDTMWTKRDGKHSWQGKENVGRLTIDGMFKRLKNDVKLAKKVAVARREVMARAEKQRRNYARRQLREHAQAMIDIMRNHPEIVLPACTLGDIANPDVFKDEE